MSSNLASHTVSSKAQATTTPPATDPRAVAPTATLRTSIRAGEGRRIDPDGEYYPTKK